MDSSILNVNVSCFENCSGTIPKDIRLLSWLTSEKHKDKVEQLRTIQDENLQKIIKASLPAITPSGVFSYRAEKDLISHTGFLSFDIDYKDNKHISNFDGLKEQISHISSVAYCGLSVRGKGFWGLVPIPKSTPTEHRQRFDSLAKDFKYYGINLDASGKDICRLRIYSWDSEAYFNHNATTYTKILLPHPKPGKRPAYSDTRERVEAVIERIQRDKTDITEGYKENWFTLGCALSKEFGEAGRGYFHTISRFNPKYSPSATDTQFNHCLKHNYQQINIGSFFYIAERHGIGQDNGEFAKEGSFNGNRFVGGELDAPPKTLDKIGISRKNLFKKESWDAEIMELEKLLRLVKIPSEPVRLDSITIISDPLYFTSTHLNIIKKHNGNPRYKPDLERLQAFMKILVN